MTRKVPEIDESEQQAKKAERAAKQELDRKLYKDFSAKFQEHAQRGVALSIVGTLDNTLKESILLLLVDDKSVSNAMFSETGPLGSFGARIRLGYLLGVYEKQVYEDLITISKIRNAFAHRPDVKDFSHPEIQGHCKNLLLLDHIKAILSESDPLHRYSMLGTIVESGKAVDNVAFRFLTGIAALGRYIRRGAEDKKASRVSETRLNPLLEI